jgi:ribonuclease-3
MPDREFAHFAERIGLPGLDSSLLRQALTHRSFSEGTDLPNNERLEFLGDSILGMLVGEYLFQQHPDLSEGELTRMRARLVNRASLAQAAAQLELSPLVRMGPTELATRGAERPGLLSDAFEALLAAIYLDRGLEAARGFVREHLLTRIDTSGRWDHKSHLQELVQSKRRLTPTYRIREESGPAHDRQFVAEVVIKGSVYGWGAGRSKKDAEQAAAADALASIDASGRRRRRRGEAREDQPLDCSLIDT